MLFSPRLLFSCSLFGLAAAGGNPFSENNHHSQGAWKPTDSHQHPHVPKPDVNVANYIPTINTDGNNDIGNDKKSGWGGGGGFNNNHEYHNCCDASATITVTTGGDTATTTLTETTTITSGETTTETETVTTTINEGTTETETVTTTLNEGSTTTVTIPVETCSESSGAGG
ncbi:hypothetical protein ASPWEDRAFT_171470 [Aspergillus wentii DTO 134E9]|uniref:Uncharacterized protein n=1 Tax=Aspergillus wentii DTO 134E9 TaxID=1073089 RepID=A0A1L9RI73_ASPWE|nr:uncharacterized protein ASPWEDRAFT_171470 [Aspergillus wentii DTO 134E9]KAI9932408.1 hypothetical protein MW887_009921 [Aspergillus wentii]OJJ34626.1 hypothetical protein ASPWEDRAFT_171470 [Aspergillus wentii DTO 134E9]